MNPTGLRALIVEDDHAWQQILNEILTDAGLTVDMADNLEAAIPIMRSTPHRLAVVDLSLSGSDHHNQEGLGVLDAVHLHDPGCVAILLTGFATVELAVNVLTGHGAFTCLRKEAFRRAEFRELIQRALASATPVPAPHDASADQAQSLRADAEEISNLALIIEDDAGWRSILSELLADTGYRTRACASYGEALGYMRREEYALAVVDLSLASSGLFEPAGKRPSAQNMDGYRLLASTRARGIPTIVVSGVGTPSDIEHSYTEHGIFAYLEKQSFDRRVFLRVVNQARTASRSNDALAGLTEREREVLELLARGMTNKEISDKLFITTNTVKRHLKSIFGKLGIHTRSAAAAKAIGIGVSAERVSSQQEREAGL